MNIKNIAINAAVSLGIALATAGLYYYFLQPRIGYVRTTDLLSGYKAMTRVNKTFEEEMKIAYVNLDTLKRRYYAVKNNTRLKSKSPEDWGYQVAGAEGDLTKYQQEADKQLQMRRQQLTSGVLNAVNGFIEEYGKKHRYKVILGANGDGALLYGLKEDDLTKEILEQLNEKFLSDSVSTK